MISFSKSLKEGQFPQVVALVLLLLLFFVGAVPGYLAGRFSWQEPPPIPNFKQIREIRQAGLSLPGWKTLQQQEQQIGGRKWSLQVIQKEGSQQEAILLLLPQNGPRDQPQVEWTEIDNSWRWDIAQLSRANFTVKSPNTSSEKGEAKIEARFFRGFANQQTFAVLQWYAMPNGGNPSPSRWFFTDQMAQWQKERAPWVGVSIMMPMEPLGDVEKFWPQAQSLGITVQNALLKKGLATRN